MVDPLGANRETVVTQVITDHIQGSRRRRIQKSISECTSTDWVPFLSARKRKLKLQFHIGLQKFHNKRLQKLLPALMRHAAVRFRW